MLVLAVATVSVAVQAKPDDKYKDTKEYLTLRDTMHHAFNNGDSAHFFVSVRKLRATYMLTTHNDVMRLFSN